MTYLAAKLRQLRKEHGLTQEQLGAALHVTRQTISNWENDRAQPDYGTLSTIADYFSVPVSALLSEEETVSPRLLPEPPEAPQLVSIPSEPISDTSASSESALQECIVPKQTHNRLRAHVLIAAAALCVLLLTLTVVLPEKPDASAFTIEYFTDRHADAGASSLQIYTREESARYIQSRPEATPHWNVRLFLKGIGPENLTIRMITTVLFFRDGSQRIDALESQRLLSNIGHPSVIPEEMRFFTFSSVADEAHVGVGVEVQATDDAGTEHCFTFYQPFEYTSR